MCRPSPDTHERNEREEVGFLEPQKARAARHENNTNKKAACLKRQAAYRESLAHRHAEVERCYRQVPAGYLGGGYNPPNRGGERTCADNGLFFTV